MDLEYLEEENIYDSHSVLRRVIAKQFYPYNSLDEIVKECQDPGDLLNIFVQNRVKWSDITLDNKILLPDEIRRLKMANCLENSMFTLFISDELGYGCKLYVMYFIDLETGKETPEMFGHIVPIFKSKSSSNVYLWNYFAIGAGNVAGPFKNYEEAGKMCDSFYRVLFDSRPFKSRDRKKSKSTHEMIESDDYPVVTVGQYLEFDDLYKLRKIISNNTNITQRELNFKTSKIISKRAKEISEEYKNKQEYGLKYDNSEISHLARVIKSKQNSQSCSVLLDNPTKQSAKNFEKAINKFVFRRYGRVK